MTKNPKLDRQGTVDFLESLAAAAAGAKIVSDGVQYVDNAMFWKWMSQSYPNVFRGDLASWIESTPKQAEQLIRAKGLEWDVFRRHHPHFLDLNRLSQSQADSVKDLTSFNPFTRHEDSIQVKAYLSEGGVKGVVRRMFDRYPPDTKFAVNQSVYDEAIKQGMPRDRFAEVVPDDQVRFAGKQRTEAAQTGNVDVGVSLNGALKEVGRGALVGAVLYVGVSALSHYQRYRSGELSFEGYAKQVGKDGLKGGVTGGSMAAVNLGVQYAAVALGVGTPVTIPVMLIIGVGLRKVVDPIFGDGEYAETLHHMQYAANVVEGWLDFGRLSNTLFDFQKNALAEARARVARGALLDSVSRVFDEEIEKGLETI